MGQGAIRGGELVPGLGAQGETKIVQGQDLVENLGISPDPGVVQHPNRDQDHCIIQNLEIGQGPSQGIDLNLLIRLDLKKDPQKPKKKHHAQSLAEDPSQGRPADLEVDLAHNHDISAAIVILFENYSKV